MVKTRPVPSTGTPGVDLELDQRLPAVTDDNTADYRLLSTSTDQRCIGCYPVGTKGGEIAGGLDQVRLALPIESDQCGDPRYQRQLSARVATKISDAQMPQVHSITRSVIG
jgi:hypothetical protein